MGALKLFGRLTQNPCGGGVQECLELLSLIQICLFDPTCFPPPGNCHMTPLRQHMLARQPALQGTASPANVDAPASRAKPNLCGGRSP